MVMTVYVEVYLVCLTITMRTLKFIKTIKLRISKNTSYSPNSLYYSATTAATATATGYLKGWFW